MFTLFQAQDLLAQAQAQGATDSDLFVWQSDLFESSVRLGVVEKVRAASGKKMTLRVFHGKRSATIATSDFTAASLSTLVSETCALARIAPEDVCAGLPEHKDIEKEPPTYDLHDETLATVSIDEKIALAQRMEEVARTTDPRVTRSDGGSVDHETHTFFYAATNGFAGHYTSTAISLSVTPIAAHEGTLQRDYAYSTRRKYNDLESPEAVGQRAALRAARRLGARSVPTQEVPIVFDPETASSLLSHWASALSGYALYKKASFLVDRIGTKVASEAVTIDDDPTLPGGLGTRPFDGEGLPSYKKRVIGKGMLQSYLLDTYSGKKLGRPSTGNAVWADGGAPAVGVSNFHMRPGEVSPEAILKSVRRGLYVTELMGFGVNFVTGDYSRGAAGFWVENGECLFPVEEVTLAGNLRTMFCDIEAVGNDLDPWKKVSAPTLRIARMQVAGK